MCIIYGRKYSLSKKLYVLLLFMREAGQECEKIIFFFFIFFKGFDKNGDGFFGKRKLFFRGLYFFRGVRFESEAGFVSFQTALFFHIVFR